jgi:hypothetical protein
MQIKIFYFLIFAALITVSGVASGASLNEHTTDEWRSILAIPNSSTMLTGLQIYIAISPDQYYLLPGSEVNISGVISSVFDPIKNVPIILARGNGTNPIPYVNLTSDENGEFSFTDQVNTSGIVRYQAWFEGSDLKDKNLTRSYEIEVRVVTDVTDKNLSEPAPMTSILETSVQENGTENNEADEDTISNEKEQLTGNSSDINLQITPESFTTGQNITLTGVIFGNDRTPLPHAPVSIEMKEDGNEFVKIGDTLSTDTSGKFTASYYLTGPDALLFRVVSSDEQGKNLVSNRVQVPFEMTEDFSPRAFERTESRHIDANLNAAIIRPDNNISISGWFSNGNGDGIAAGRLNLYWYNFADRIWDKYENCSEAITNHDGFFSFNVTGPNLTGISYLAVVSKKEQTGKPLFSHVLPLAVRGQTENKSLKLPAEFTVKSEPSEVRVNEKALITFTLTDPDGNPLAEEPVKMYFSEDGFNWFMNGNGNITTRSDGTIAMVDIPKASGFHYYRGIYDGSEFFGPADSGILTLIITEPEDMETIKSA